MLFIIILVLFLVFVVRGILVYLIGNIVTVIILYLILWTISAPPPNNINFYFSQKITSYNNIALNLCVSLTLSYKMSYVSILFMTFKQGSTVICFRLCTVISTLVSINGFSDFLHVRSMSCYIK